ncbi:MAG: type II toxin-antitoxin system RelE/ParE family toxin [Gammaproteobacteria bacterium]|uniref:type II toxin-antitoxin system RelE family toxin n=1 Tax=Methylotuvimicrobium sp. TaxID=2822413 RepID=UPI001D3E925A|nr:type II toxin-antitoxin system RelE/ParE family toxin [Gammaproteobacteria bacterium]
MSYALKIKPNAQKELARLSKSVANAAIKKIRALADDPYPTGCKKLVGSDHTYRIRTGDYRIIYTVLNAVLTVEVIKIGHRKNVYR